MTKLADTVTDLASVVELGTRWGETLAQTAAAWDLAYVLRRGDRRGLELLLERELDGERLHDLLDFVYDAPPPYRWMSAGHPAWELARDRRAVDIRGRAARPTSLRYENPLELILCGAGSLLMGAIVVARLVRDWSSQRRIAAAAVAQAKAEARKAHAEAERAEIATDFARWMADEARAGRGALPQLELLKAITPDEARAIDRLAEQDVQLSLPPGFGEAK